MSYTIHRSSDIDKPTTLKAELKALKPGKALMIHGESMRERSGNQSRACAAAKKLGIRVRTTRVNGGVVVQLVDEAAS